MFNTSGPETAKISLFLSGFFRWNSFGKKYCSKHRNWTLRSSLSKTVLMSYSEKSPGYLAQMQNWPSVWPKNSWGAGDGQPATNFFVPSLRYFGLWLRGDQRVQQHVTFSYSSKSKQKIWTTKFISSQKIFRRVFRRFSKENFTEKKSLRTLLQDEVLTQFW